MGVGVDFGSCLLHNFRSSLFWRACMLSESWDIAILAFLFTNFNLLYSPKFAPGCIKFGFKFLPLDPKISICCSSKGTYFKEWVWLNCSVYPKHLVVCQMYIVQNQIEQCFKFINVCLIISRK